MRINEQQLDRIYRTIYLKKTRNVLKVLSESEPITFSQFKGLIGNITDSNNITAYFVKKLVKSNLIKKDKKTGYYLLTRFGVQVHDLMKSFESICTEYDMTDCDGDGKINMVIKRNIGKRRIRI